jgi:pre-rRNA-processing protein TSR3
LQRVALERLENFIEQKYRMGKGNKARNTSSSRGGTTRAERTSGVGSSTQDVQRRNGEFDGDFAVGDDDEDAEDDELNAKRSESLECRVFLWEFGQNDSKRDSGSKMVRLGYAKRLRIGQSFPGVVLSSEAKTFVSPEDTDLVEKNGVAGINCSWNRLDEIPFGSIGNDIRLLIRYLNGSRIACASALKPVM